MIHRIRWQILIAVCTAFIVFGLLGSSALSTAASNRPLDGSVFVEGVVGTLEQLNPLVQGPESSPAERDIAALLFDGLTTIGPGGRVVPALAERWSVTPDGRIYTFTLRNDRAWHDGAPVTADDVLYTVRGVQNANFPGDPQLAALWRNVLVRKLDDRTVEFELTMPFAPFPSVARLPLLPAHILRTLRSEQWASAPFSQRPVGTGRYKLHALDAQQAVLVPATDDIAGDAFDNLVFRLYPTIDAAALGLARREVQAVAAVASGGRQLPAPPRHTRRGLAPLGDYTVLTFNLQQAPLDDLQLRNALAMSINREALIANVLSGQGQVLDTPILPGTWAADTGSRLPAFRRSAAQQLLGTLGYRDTNGDGWLEAEGQRLVLPLLVADSAEATAVANELARQLAEVGVELQIRRTPVVDLRTDLAAHNFTLALHSWSDVGADPDVFSLWHSSRADGGTNYAGLRDPRIDQLLSDGRTTTDESARRRIYAEFQRRWVELVPSLPLYQTVLAYDVATETAPPPAPALIPVKPDRFVMVERWMSIEP